MNPRVFAVYDRGDGRRSLFSYTRHEAGIGVHCQNQLNKVVGAGNKDMHTLKLTSHWETHSFWIFAGVLEPLDFAMLLFVIKSNLRRFNKVFTLSKESNSFPISYFMILTYYKQIKYWCNTISVCICVMTPGCCVVQHLRRFCLFSLIAIIN